MCVVVSIGEMAIVGGRSIDASMEADMFAIVVCRNRKESSWDRAA